SRRLRDVLQGQFSKSNRTGTVTVTSTASSDGLYPVVRAEALNDTDKSKAVGQDIIPLAAPDAAALNQTQYLTGLRQDAKYQTTLWITNPGTDRATYDLIYRDLAGNILGRV